MIALRGGLVHDGAGRTWQDATVVISRGKVVSVEEQGDSPSGATPVDVSGFNILPGLIDCHIHFAMWGQDLMAKPGMRLMQLAAETSGLLGAALRRGCTTARDPGGLDPGFRDAINAGSIDGPRIQTSTVILSPTGGLSDRATPIGAQVPQIPGFVDPVFDGPLAARAKVREVAASGADFIKIATTGGVSSVRCPPDMQVLREDEMYALITEAHELNLKVACHAVSGKGVLNAVRAGVDSIEHGADLSDDCVKLMAERGTWYVPTFSAYRLHEKYGSRFKQERSRAMAAHHRASFRRALDAGVQIAMGSDAGGYGLDFTAELEELVAAGMTPMQAVIAATSAGAACMGLEKEVGTLAPGMLADLIVVKGDPTRDVKVLRSPENIALVLKGGKPVGGSFTDGPTKIAYRDIAGPHTEQYYLA